MWLTAILLQLPQWGGGAVLYKLAQYRWQSGEELSKEHGMFRGKQGRGGVVNSLRYTAGYQ